jgi:predicted ABC-class ATPase
VADTVIVMDAYVPSDATAAAKAIAARHAGAGDRLPQLPDYGEVTPRTLVSGAPSAATSAWISPAACSVE